MRQEFTTHLIYASDLFTNIPSFVFYPRRQQLLYYAWYHKLRVLLGRKNK